MTQRDQHIVAHLNDQFWVKKEKTKELKTSGQYYICELIFDSELWTRILRLAKIYFSGFQYINCDKFFIVSHTSS